LPKFFPEDWRRKLRRFFLRVDSWIDFTLFRSAKEARENYERFSTFMDRFHVAGWRRMLVEAFSESATRLPHHLGRRLAEKLRTLGHLPRPLRQRRWPAWAPAQ
jgi:hypothetical protein